MRSEIFNHIGLQDVDKYKNYKDSYYLIIHNYNNYRIIYNILTSEIICHLVDEVLDDNYLISHWFKIPYSFSDRTLGIILNKYLFRTEHRTLSSTNHFLIFTTMNCNARCSYCYEKDRINKHPMTEDTAKKVGEFICNNSDNIFLSWFGGEPLLNTKAIDIITDKLNTENKVYKSFITTNGFYLDKISIYKLRYKWRVTKIQLTIDGTEENYLKEKNYINNDPSVFKRLINRIIELTNNRIQVSIRLNITIDNKDDMINLIEYLDSIKEIDRKYFSIYASKIFENTYTEDQKKILNQNELSVNRFILQKNLYFRTSIFVTPAMYRCYTTSHSGCTINVDGKIGACQHESEDEYMIKSIDNPIVTFDDYDKFIKPKISKNCEFCKFESICNFNEFCTGIDECTKQELEYWEDYVRLYLEIILINWFKQENIDNDEVTK